MNRRSFRRSLAVGSGSGKIEKASHAIFFAHCNNALTHTGSMAVLVGHPFDLVKVRY